MTLEVLRAGALTTVQDLGRPGHGASGVPASGALDPFALRAANLIVGNDERAAGLEITVAGPTLRFDAPALIALTGSLFDAVLDGERVPWHAAIAVPAGATLAVGRARDGARCYLAVRGGIDASLVLGSRSTHVGAAFGGLRLADGMRIPTAAIDGESQLARLRNGTLPAHEVETHVRVVPGAQIDMFAREARDALHATSWRVSTRADRTGVRLEGRALSCSSHEIPPEGVTRGAIQVPPDGLPIIVCADGPATGGYAKIANVIAADLGLIAHSKPGDTLRFMPCEVDEARAAWRERISAIRNGIEVLP